MSKTEKSYMQVALEQAEKAAAGGEVPVGAVLVESFSGEMIAASGNRVEELHDPTAHAEMLVLRLGGQRLCASRLPVCDLYVTLEPCPMCAHAFLSRVYVGCISEHLILRGAALIMAPRFLLRAPADMSQKLTEVLRKKPARRCCVFFSERR